MRSSVIVTGPEEADGSPWLVDTTSLGRALTDAYERLGAY